jgi:hypothetical protein
VRETPNLLNKLFNQISLAVVLARDMNSALMLDQATMGCFLKLQEIMLGPKSNSH